MDLPDPATWSGVGYTLRINSLMLNRRQRLVQAAIAYADRNGFTYDALIVARPDSVIRARGSMNKELSHLAALLSEDISHSVGTDTVGVDMIEFDANKSDPNIALFKYDVFIASPGAASIAMGLIDVINANNGEYHKTYTRPSFRCNFCRSLFNNSSIICKSCGKSDTLSNVAGWVEYKLAEHITASGLPFRVLGLTGNVLRV